MKSVNNYWFDELYKISIYRDLSEQLLERALMTKHEYEMITRRIDAMEDNLIKPSANSEQHKRKNTAV